MLRSTGLLLLLLVTTPAAAQTPAKEGSEERIRKLEERIAGLESRLERLLALLEESGKAPDEPPPQAEAEATPAEGASQTPPPAVTAEVLEEGLDTDEKAYMPVSGYMDFHVNNDGLNPTTLDFHRFVLMFGHVFSDRIRFWSEVELEHAFVEGGEPTGEVELEQAYLDFLVHPKFNFRAGMLLTPIGIINERHEPPSFHGVERPFNDTVIIPSTWFGSGAGLSGDLGKGFAYRTYVMSSLDGSQFSADEGFREGRQKGFFENARNLAWVGRLEYRGLPGATFGTSYWTGETGFNFNNLNGRAKIFEFDGRYRRGRFEGRGQFALTDLNDAAQINRAQLQQTGINPNIAERMRGFYLEGAANLFPTRLRHDLVAFYRYENFDTQFRMPAGFLPLKQFDRSAHIIGLSYFPVADIAFKFDYNILRNQSLVVKPPNRWNIGVGWWF